MDRCPTCHQPIKAPPVPKKICAKCKKPIALAHKWYYAPIDLGRVTPTHRDCDNPESYGNERALK